MASSSFSLWQDLEGLQKKREKLEGQLRSFVEQSKTLEESMKVIEGGLGIQEERVRKLEVQLKEKHEAISTLESRLLGLEKILKRPLKEPVEEEPLNLFHLNTLLAVEKIIRL